MIIFLRYCSKNFDAKCMLLCILAICFLPAIGDLRPRQDDRDNNMDDVIYNHHDTNERPNSAREKSFEENIVAFAKSGIAHLFQKDMSSHCFEAKSLTGILELIGVYLGFGSNAENFEFFVGTDSFCYSYNIVHDSINTKTRVSKCHSADELTDLLLFWLKKSPVYGSMQGNQNILENYNRLTENYLWNVFLLLMGAFAFYLIQLGVKLSVFSHLRQLVHKQIHKAFDCIVIMKDSFASFINVMLDIGEKRFDKASERLFKLKTALVEIIRKTIAAIYIHTQQIIGKLVRFLPYLVLSETFNLNKKAHIHRRNAQACWNKLQVLRGCCTKQTKSISSVRGKARRKLVKKNMVKISNKTSSNDSFVTVNNDAYCDANIKERNQNDNFVIIHDSSQRAPSTGSFSSIGSTSLSQVSFTKATKTDSEPSKPEFDRIPGNVKSSEQTSYSSWSNSSYEVIPLSISEGDKKSQDEILHNSARSPSLSVSSITESTKSNYVESNSSFKSNHENNNNTVDQPFGFSRAFTPPSIPYTGICLDFGVQNVTSQPWGEPSKVNTSEFPKQKSAFKLWNNDSNNKEEISSHQFPFEPKTKNKDIFEDFGQQIDDNSKKAHDKPKSVQKGWPINDFQAPNVWDTNHDVPVLNSFKRSFKTESSFNFDDSRFNSVKSDKNSDFPNKTDLPKFTQFSNNDAGNGVLCDFSHLLNLPAKSNIPEVSPQNDLEPRCLNSQLFPNVLPKHDVNQDQKANEYFLPDIFSCQEDQDNSETIDSQEKLLRIFRSQRDEINALKAKIAKDEALMTEHEKILRDLHEETIVKAQTMQQNARNKLFLARQREVYRYNTILDKEVLKLYSMQRRRQNAKVREYRAKVHLKWKPFEK